MAERYNIDISSMLWLPGSVYWKNREGYYLGCNDKQLEFLNLSSKKDFVDRTIFDLIQGQCNIEECNGNDNQVIKNENAIIRFEIFVSAEKIIYPYLSIKTPLKNQKNQTVGLFGISFSLPEVNAGLIRSILATNPQQLSIPENHIRQYLARLFHIELTNRQADCLYYLALGMTNKMIAKKLGLSPRTIEIHMDILKEKLNCNNKAELMCKVIELSYLHKLRQQ